MTGCSEQPAVGACVTATEQPFAPPTLRWLCESAILALRGNMPLDTTAGLRLIAAAFAACAACSPTSGGRAPAAPWIKLDESPTETCADSVALAGKVFASGTWQCCSTLDSGVRVSWRNARTGASGGALLTIVNSGGGVSPPDVAWSAQVPLGPGENALEIVAEGALRGERAVVSSTVTAYFPCRKLAGRVATADGVALAGVAIALSDGRPAATVHSDADGRFVLEAAGSFPFEIVPSLPRLAFVPSAHRGTPGDDLSGLDFVGDHDGLPAWAARLGAGFAIDAIPLDGAGALVAFYRFTGGGAYFVDVQGGWVELDGFGRAVRSGYAANGTSSILGETGDFVRAVGVLDDGTAALAGSRTDAQGNPRLWAVAQGQPDDSWGLMPKGAFSLAVRDVVRASGGGVWVVGADSFGDFFLRVRPQWYPWFGSFDDLTGLVLADGTSGVYVTGTYGSTSPRVLVVRQDGDGRIAWSRAYGPGKPRAVITDAGGVAVAADEPEGPRLLAVDGAGRVRFTRAWSVPGASVRALSAAPDGYRIFLETLDNGLVLLTTDASGTLTSLARTPLPKQALIRGASDGSAVAWTGTGVWRLDARGGVPSCGDGASLPPAPERAASSEAIDESVVSGGGGFFPEPVSLGMSWATAAPTEATDCSPY